MDSPLLWIVLFFAAAYLISRIGSPNRKRPRRRRPFYGGGADAPDVSSHRHWPTDSGSHDGPSHPHDHGHDTHDAGDASDSTGDSSD